MNNSLISALALLCLAPILSSCGQADASRYKSPTKVCPGGVIVRSNQRCPVTPPSPPPPAPYFSVAGETVSESAGSVIVHVTKTGTTTLSSTVSYSTGATGDTALAGSDYTATSGTLTFAANETDKAITIPIINDSVWESNETFTVKITAGTNANINIGSTPVIITDDDPLPIQTPPTPSEPVVSPNGTSGEFDVADNFTTSTTLTTTIETVPASLDPVGAFRFTCLSGQLRYDDPIVYPGQAGKSHLHQFFGNTGTDYNSTYNSLRTTGTSTCVHDGSNVPLTNSPQRTAYWEPAMLDGAGNAVKPNYLLTYYKNFPNTDPACGHAPDATHFGYCIAVPNGLRIITGYSMSAGTDSPTNPNSRMYWSIAFECITADQQTSLSGVQHSLAAVAASGKCGVAGALLRVALSFPNCWDGVNLDVANHRSHMVFANGAIIDNFGAACPADHPYIIPQIALQTFFTIDDNFLAGKWHFSSDEMVPGAPAGYTFHADYWEAWSPVVKADWQAGCIDGHKSCNVGEMGNGQSIIGMGPQNPPTHVLVPLSSIP